MLTNVDFIKGLDESRAKFLRHLTGLSEDQIDFKPFAECKSVRETVSHLIVDDLAALDSLKSGKEADYDALAVAETDYEKLVEMLKSSHEALLAYLRENLGGKPLEQEITIWGDKMPAARGIAYLSSEDFYHAGQVAFIRMASDPTWDCYAAIYGPA